MRFKFDAGDKRGYRRYIGTKLRVDGSDRRPIGRKVILNALSAGVGSFEDFEGERHAVSVLGIQKGVVGALLEGATILIPELI